MPLCFLNVSLPILDYGRSAYPQLRPSRVKMRSDAVLGKLPKSSSVLQWLCYVPSVNAGNLSEIYRLLTGIPTLNARPQSGKIEAIAGAVRLSSGVATD